MGFLRQVTGENSKQLRYGLWRQVAAKQFLQGAGIQPLRAYVDRIQVKVAEWVALRPISGVCSKETGYRGGGGVRVLWWRQEAAEKQLKFTVEAILAAAATVWQQQEYGRCDGSKGGL